MKSIRKHLPTYSVAAIFFGSESKHITPEYVLRVEPRLALKAAGQTRGIDCAILLAIVADDLDDLCRVERGLRRAARRGLRLAFAN